VLSYLGRYTHRVAIANWRLVNLTDDEVPLLLEGLPPPWQVEDYAPQRGFLANSHRGAKLALCRNLLGARLLSR
jgi:hypothetical protein